MIIIIITIIIIIIKTVAKFMKILGRLKSCTTRPHDPTLKL